MPIRLLFIQSIVGGAIPVGGLVMPDMLFVTHQEPSGTSGGATALSAWTTRPLNTLEHDDIGATLSANRLTLPAGTYAALAGCSVYNPELTLHRIYDVTNSVELLRGHGARRPNHATLFGMFTLAGAADIELQVYSTQTTVQAQRMGWAVGEGTANEVHASLILEKVA